MDSYAHNKRVVSGTSYRLALLGLHAQLPASLEGRHVALEYKGDPPDFNTNKYRRNWLLSICAYSNRRQETMRLIKSMRLTVSVSVLGIEGGASPSTSCVSRHELSHAYACSLVLAFFNLAFDENSLDSLGWSIVCVHDLGHRSARANSWRSRNVRSLTACA